MKKYLLCILLAAMLLFSGCALQKTKPDKADVSSFFENINASFSASFGGLETEGNISFTPDKLTLEFTSPQTVSGLRITVYENEVTLSLGNLEITKQNSPVTKQFNAVKLFSVLNCARTEGVFGNSDGKTVVSGDGFEITLDAENRVSEIVIPSKSIDMKLEW